MSWSNSPQSYNHFTLTADQKTTFGLKHKSMLHVFPSDRLLYDSVWSQYLYQVQDSKAITSHHLKCCQSKKNNTHMNYHLKEVRKMVLRWKFFGIFLSLWGHLRHTRKIYLTVWPLKIIYYQHSLNYRELLTLILQSVNCFAIESKSS